MTCLGYVIVVTVRGPAFGIKVANVASRLTRVSRLSTFCRFESPGPNICTSDGTAVYLFEATSVRC